MKPESSLSQRVAKGGVWVFTLRLLEKGLGLIKLVILARLLAPHDFGLFGIALLAMSTLETFSQTGFQTALIQKKEDITQYLDTAWTISVIRAIILFVILFFSASYVALFFDTPQASLIIKVIGISMLLGGFTNIGTVFFQKELKFNKQFIYRFSTALAEFVVVISAALAFRNVWAFVYGSLAGGVTGLVAGYVIHPYRPRFRFDLNKAKELFGFGKWLFGSSIVIFLVTQGDDAFVGKALGATMLGFYQIAFRIANMPSSEFTGMIGRVTFPAYSKLQAVPQQLREAYLRTMNFSTFLSIPFAGGIIVLAPQFTQTFLGEKWLPIITPIQILAISGLFRSIAGTGSAMFNAIGKPKLDFKMNITRLVVIVLSIYPLTKIWGISGTSLSVLFGIIVACFIWVRASIKETKTSSGDYFATILPPTIGTIIMCGIIVYILKTIAFTDEQWLVLLMSIMLGVLGYVGTMFFIEKKSRYNVLHDIKVMVKNLYE